MNSRRVDFFAMRIVLPIVYFRRSISAQEKFAQKVKECLMARTLDLIRGYMFSHRTEPRGAGTGSDQVLTKFFTRKPCPYRKFHLGDQVRGDGCSVRSTSSPVSQMATTRSNSGKGSGFSSSALTALKIAVFAPMPSASVSMAINVKPGCLATF